MVSWIILSAAILVTFSISTYIKNASLKQKNQELQLRVKQLEEEKTQWGMDF